MYYNCNATGIQDKLLLKINKHCFEALGPQTWCEALYNQLSWQSEKVSYIHTHFSSFCNDMIESRII